MPDHLILGLLLIAPGYSVGWTAAKAVQLLWPSAAASKPYLLWNKEVDLDNDAVKAMLCTTPYTPGCNWIGNHTERWYDHA